ncbi:ORF6N domain-containing protein [Desulfoscipio geothermicus]|uniref:ORF6N domain-containing protein n=1 Tax=Desulfoscipio geothermicus DSM 3669 TaxID=1121426 RepID=A0A1I6ECD4_9FIRM|nr:ORF6N domain-containing protein [Desulfoscipio geothermicus]SFR15413.1 ORF6N domain-containing protein [Desulfoscipio geothermicus DSM 3669]
MAKIVQLTIGDQHHEMAVKEYHGQRVVTFRDIDELHRRPEGTARRNFNENKHHFIKGDDYFVRNSYEAKTEFGIIAPNGLVLLTESGYLMLVKSFTDDLAWQVQRQLVNHYFRSKALAAPKDNSLRQAEIEARLRNAKTRQARLMKQMAEDFKGQLSPESIQLLIAGATELIMGKALLPKPQIDIHFTATEIAEEIGVSANKVGRVANKLNLKTSEFGKWILDKSPHSDKQVKTFVYNEKGRQALFEAIKREMRVVPINGAADSDTTGTG